MPLVECPRCSEDEDLQVVVRRSETQTELRCDSCGHQWLRDSELRCRLCGSTDLRYTPEATVWEKGRGDQRTPAGISDAYACWECGGRRVTSNDPIPADETGTDQ